MNVPTTIRRLLDYCRLRDAEIAAKVKPVYMTVNPHGQTPPAWTLPATWAHGSRYSDLVVPRKSGDASWLNIDHENLRAFGRICRDGGVLTAWGGEKFDIAAGAPVLFDWEGSYSPENFPVFRDHIRAFKEEAPHVLIGVYGLTWLGTGGSLDAVVATEKTTRIILDECDMICQSCYLTHAANVAEDVANLRQEIRLAKYRFPDKKHLPFVTQRYVFEEREIGREGDALIEMLLQETDGLMWWGSASRAVEVLWHVAGNQN